MGRRCCGILDENVKVFLGLGHLARLACIKRRAVNTISKLQVEAHIDAEHIPYQKRLDYPYKKVNRLGALGGMGKGAWLHLQGELKEGLSADSAYIWLDTWGEGALFGQDGSPEIGLNTVGGILDIFSLPLSKKIFPIPQRCYEEGKIDLWVETANNGLGGISYGKSRLIRANVFTFDQEIKAYYYDYLTVYFACQNAKDAAEKKRLSRLLSKSYALSRTSVEKARLLLSTEFQKTDKTDISVSAIGHSHLDVAWLWKVNETVRKSARTFSSAIFNFQKYPNYIFCASQPLVYQMIKDNYPALFERVKEAVAAGKIEPIGDMWVEADMNLTGGESIIRQIYYGRKFFREEFGKESDICWLPDVFGFCGSLPQILTKSGFKYFSTIKISWNECNKFPYTTFLWKGIDNESEVLVHMPPEGNYGSDAAPHSVKKALRQNKDNPNIVKSFLMPFGSSDGGGGAGEGHLETLMRTSKLKGYPDITVQPVSQFFKELESVRDNLSVHQGELYLETHQGTYTTQSENKRLNRLAEMRMHNLEALWAIAAEQLPYDPDKAERLWKHILLEQFHDILPGTSIAAVHTESVERYNAFLPLLQEQTEELMNALGKPEKGAYSAVNLSPVRQKGWFNSPYGWTFLDIAPYSAQQIKISESMDTALLSSDGSSISNGIIRLCFDKQGTVCSLVDMQSGRQYSKGGLNRLTIYRDKRRFWNASNLDYTYYKRRKRYFRLLSYKIYKDGPCIIRENLLKSGSSVITQRIILKLGCPYMECKTVVDWRKTHKMLRADFFPFGYGDKSVADIQMGNISRSTGMSSPIEKAQLDICAHKWLDVSGAEFGSAVMSNSKYGYRAKEGLVSLNLLRSTQYPAPRADKGHHQFTYAYYPHGNDPALRCVKDAAYGFCIPPLFYEGILELPPIVEVSAANIIAETIKPAEQGGYLVRLYEDCGEQSTACLKFSLPYKNAFLADMTENILEPVNPEKLSFKPYEIKTLIFK